jgi:hypothetical protein
MEVNREAGAPPTASRLSCLDGVFALMEASS